MSQYSHHWYLLSPYSRADAVLGIQGGQTDQLSYILGIFFFFFFSLLRMNGFQSLQDREYSGRSVLLKLLLILKKKKLEYDCFTMLC